MVSAKKIKAKAYIQEETFGEGVRLTPRDRHSIHWICASKDRGIYNEAFIRKGRVRFKTHIAKASRRWW